MLYAAAVVTSSTTPRASNRPRTRSIRTSGTSTSRVIASVNKSTSCSSSLKTALSIDLVGVPKGDYPIRVLDAVIAEMALVAIEAECAAAPSCFVKSDAFNLAAYGTTINTAFGKPDLSNIPGLRVKG